MLIDTNRTILAVNEGGAKRLGKTVEELTNSSLYSFHTIIPSDLATERARQADEVIHSGSPRCFQDQYGGRYFDHLFYPVFDAHGAVTRLALYTRDITEQKQSEETLCRQRMLLQGVAQATTRLLATSDYEAGINNALTIMGETLGVDRIHIFEYHPHSKTSDMLISLRFEWAGETTEPRLDDPLLQNFPIRESGLAYWYDQLVADGFAGGIVRNFAEQAQSFFAARNILSLQVVPVLVDDEVWGIIAFEDCHAEREWEKTEINVLQTMAVSVGAAIKRSQFEGQLRREREIADTLREIGTELTSTLDLDEVLGRLLDQVGRVVPYDTANVMLIRDGTTHIESFTNYDHFGLSADEVRQITFRIDKSPIMKHIVQTRKPYVCSHTRDEPHWIKIHRVDWIESWLGVPIEVWGKVVGFFSLDSTQPGFYGQEHIDLMDLFAQQAANAFKNAMLFANTQELEQLKSRMIRIASHDLRSPLTRIIGATELLEEELDAQLTSNQSELLNKIWKAIRQMEQIINDILSLERIEAYHQKLEPVLWRALINRAVDDLRADLEAKQHTLQIECEPDLPTTRGDPAQLGQALTNLVSNAIKYTPPGGQITIRAFVRDYDGKPTLTVEVEDHGIGIPRERQTRLFQPFYRARQAGAEDIPGVGLGLSVKTTIEQHYGNVYCHSEPGQGSTFGFWVPV
jgi:signal transduction histidine kinase